MYREKGVEDGNLFSFKGCTRWAAASKLKRAARPSLESRQKEITIQVYQRSSLHCCTPVIA